MHRGNNKRAIEQFVAALTRRLGNQKTAMTRGSERSALIAMLHRMLRAHRIVAAQSSRIERDMEVTVEIAGHFDKPA